MGGKKGYTLARTFGDVAVLALGETIHSQYIHGERFVAPLRIGH